MPRVEKEGSPNQRGDQDPKELFFPHQMDPQSLLIPSRMPPRPQRKPVELVICTFKLPLYGPLEPSLTLRSPAFSCGPHGPVGSPLSFLSSTPSTPHSPVSTGSWLVMDITLPFHLAPRSHPLSETPGVPSSEENRPWAG